MNKKKIVFEPNLKTMNDKNNDNEKQSGFEPYDGPEINICRHPSHTPPMHLYIPVGQQYRHICPGCGRETVLRPLVVSFNDHNSLNDLFLQAFLKDD